MRRGSCFNPRPFLFFYYANIGFFIFLFKNLNEYFLGSLCYQRFLTDELLQRSRHSPGLRTRPD